jgi:hypothetical protein
VIVMSGLRVRGRADETFGLLLASKPRAERLTGDDASTLGIDPDRLVDTQLGHLTTATEKARRDAPAIAVCELSLASTADTCRATLAAGSNRPTASQVAAM